MVSSGLNVSVYYLRAGSNWNRLPRVYKLKRELPQVIKLREGGPGVADVGACYTRRYSGPGDQGYLADREQWFTRLVKETGLSKQQLLDCGFDDKVINVSQLRGILEAGVPAGLVLRDGEEKTVENCLRALVGRYGAEGDVFETTDLFDLLRTPDLTPACTAQIVMGGLKSLDVNNSFSDRHLWGKFVVQVAEAIYPDDPNLQGIFIGETTKYIQEGLYLMHYMGGVVAAKQKACPQAVITAFKVILPDNGSVVKKNDGSIARTSAIGVIDLVVSVSQEAYLKDSLAKGKFVAQMLTEYYPAEEVVRQVIAAVPKIPYVEYHQKDVERDWMFIGAARELFPKSIEGRITFYTVIEESLSGAHTIISLLSKDLRGTA